MKLSLFLAPLFCVSLLAAQPKQKPRVQKPQPGVQYLTITLRIPEPMADYDHLKSIVGMVDDIPYSGVYVVDVDIHTQPRRSAKRPVFLPKVDQDGNPYPEK